MQKSSDKTQINPRELLPNYQKLAQRIYMQALVEAMLNLDEPLPEGVTPRDVLEARLFILSGWAEGIAHLANFNIDIARRVLETYMNASVDKIVDAMLN